MIAAVVAVVDDDGPPPPELRLRWMCQRYEALPDAGGVNDQEYRTLHRMTVCENVHNAVSRLRSMKGAQIHQLTDNERAIIKWLIDVKVMNG